MAGQLTPGPIGARTGGQNGGQNGAADRGLTLIELLVVVVILALLALPIGLRYGGQRGGAEAAARAFEAEIALRREAAISRQRVQPLVPRSDGWEGRSFAGVEFLWNLRAGSRILAMPDGRLTPFGLRIGGLDCCSDGWEPVRCR